MMLTPGSKRFLTSSLSSRKSRVNLRLSMARLTRTKHLVKIERLGDVIEGAVFHRADGIAHGVLRGHQDHRGIDARFFDFLEQGQAVGVGQFDVHQRDVEMGFVSSWRAVLPLAVVCTQ